MRSSSGRPEDQKQRQQLVQEAAGVSDADEAAAASSDDDWLPAQNQPAADGRPTQVSRVACKVGVKSTVWAQFASCGNGCLQGDMHGSF